MINPDEFETDSVGDEIRKNKRSASLKWKIKIVFMISLAVLLINGLIFLFKNI